MIAPNVVYCFMIAISAVMIAAYSNVFVMCLFILYFILSLRSNLPPHDKIG